MVSLFADEFRSKMGLFSLFLFSSPLKLNLSQNELLHISPFEAGQKWKKNEVSSNGML